MPMRFSSLSVKTCTDSRKKQSLEISYNSRTAEGNRKRHAAVTEPGGHLRSPEDKDELQREAQR